MNNIGIRVLGQFKNYSVFLRFHNQAKLLGVKEEKYGFNLRTTKINRCLLVLTLKLEDHTSEVV